MNGIEYEDNDTFVIIKCNDKDKYKNLLKQVNAKWSRKSNGWMVQKNEIDIFKRLVEVLFNTDNTKEEIKKTEITTKTTSNRSYRRAKSPDLHSDTSSNHSDDEKISSLVGNETEKLELYSSGESDDDSDDDSHTTISSDDYPNQSPNRKKIASDEVMNKMKYAHERLNKLNLKK
jgi:hypothetical protein